MKHIWKLICLSAFRLGANNTLSAFQLCWRSAKCDAIFESNLFSLVFAECIYVSQTATGALAERHPHNSLREEAARKRSGGDKAFLGFANTKEALLKRMKPGGAHPPGRKPFVFWTLSKVEQMNMPWIWHPVLKLNRSASQFNKQ